MAGINLSQFRDFELIGQGGGADVFRAVRVSTGGQVAIKAFLATLDPATIARRVNREVGALVSLKGHPNIIQIEEVLQVDDAVYVVMEYAPHGSLADRITAEGRVDPSAVASIGAQIASALTAAHARSILHRDVKPQNILFGQYGAAKLCDFGIAAVNAGEQASRTSAISIRYASPEELDGAALTSATDVYSLGATMLHALVGRPADLNERLSGIGPLLVDVPLPLRDVVARCLQLDPLERPAAAEVQALLEGAGSTAATPSLAPPSGQPWSIELNPPLPADRAPATGGRAGVAGTTVGVIFDRAEVPPPPPEEPTPWYRGKAALSVLALVLVAGVGMTALVLTGGDDGDTAPTPTAVVVVTSTAPATTGPAATTTVVETTAPPATTTPPVTAAPPPVNAYGDVIGAPVDGSTGKPAAFARALQQRSSPSASTLNLSPAYFYGLSFELTPRVADPSVLPIATESGYTIATATGPITVRDLSLDADGNVVDGTEVGITTFLISAGVELTGVCAAGRPQPCDFSGEAGIADTAGSGTRAWVLAKVTADPERVTQMVFVDTGGPLVASASTAGQPIGVDPASGIIAVSVPVATPPGTVVPIDVVLADGRTMSFVVPAS